MQVLVLERNDKLGFNEDLSKLRGTEIVFGRRRKDSFRTGKDNSIGEEVEVGRREDVAVGRREDVADYRVFTFYHVRCHERREQMLEMQSFLHVSTSLAESYKLLEELQDFELEKCRDLMKS
ncbi:hypothetical protein Tco_0062593, partial [Tanacetum coccineum]